MSNKDELTQQSFTLQKKECSECREEISVKANKCHHCGSYQNNWQNWLSYLPYFISIVLMVVAITQLVLSSIQVKATRNELAKVEQTLRDVEEMKLKIESILKGVTLSEENISVLEKNTQETTERLNERMTVFEEALDEIADQISKALPAGEELKLAYSEHSVQKTTDGVQAIISFTSSARLPLGRIEFSIEIEDETNAKILSIGPAETITFDTVSSYATNRRKALLSYVSTGSSLTKIKVTLSAPAKLIIQGNLGLELFELDIK